MKCSGNPYAAYRYPGEVIAHAVWLYHRSCLGLRDVEDPLAERGVIVSHETIRQCCFKFGQSYARSLCRRQGHPGYTWFLDEVFVTINGERCYLWRASIWTAMCSISWCGVTVTSGPRSASS